MNPDTIDRVMKGAAVSADTALIAIMRHASGLSDDARPHVLFGCMTLLLGAVMAEQDRALFDSKEPFAADFLATAIFIGLYAGETAHSYEEGSTEGGLANFNREASWERAKAWAARMTSQ